MSAIAGHDEVVKKKEKEKKKLGFKSRILKYCTLVMCISPLIWSRATTWRNIICDFNTDRAKHGHFVWKENYVQCAQWLFKFVSLVPFHPSDHLLAQLVSCLVVFKRVSCFAWIGTRPRNDTLRTCMRPWLLPRCRLRSELSCVFFFHTIQSECRITALLSKTYIYVWWYHL